MKIRKNRNLPKTEKRFVTNTEPFRKKLIELGFVQIETKGNGLEEIRTFEKEDKYVLTGHGHMILTYFGRGKGSKDFHKGRTISEEKLKFFVKRNLT